MHAAAQAPAKPEHLAVLDALRPLARLLRLAAVRERWHKLPRSFNSGAHKRGPGERVHKFEWDDTQVRARCRRRQRQGELACSGPGSRESELDGDHPVRVESTSAVVEWHSHFTDTALSRWLKRPVHGCHDVPGQGTPTPLCVPHSLQVLTVFADVLADQ